MKVKDLKEQIADLPDDMEVFIRAKVNPCGNIIEIEASIDCVIIEPEKDDDE